MRDRDVAVRMITLTQEVWDLIDAEADRSGRTHAGLAAVRAKGRVGDRPPVLTPSVRAAIVDLRDQGKKTPEIALTLRISKAS